MAKIKTLKDYNDEIIYPQSTTRAIVNAEGVNLDTLHSKFVMMEQISEIEDIDNNYENTLNKVTVIDNTSTDEKYPSAKAVYNFINNIDLNIPEKTSELINDSGFITNAVSNLTNYYTRTEVDTAINLAIGEKLGGSY